MDLVTSSRNDHGFIIHTHANGNTKSYAGVRGGVAWPVGSQAAYLCVFGQIFYERKLWGDTVQGPIRMITEQEVKSLSNRDLFTRILDLTKQLWCEDWYCEMRYDREQITRDPWYMGFNEYMNTQGWERPMPTLQEAPWWDNFLYGLQLSYDWDNQGIVEMDPDTLLHRQIISISNADLDDRPEKRFNAVNGYRYVLASFQRSPPIIQKFGLMGGVKPEIPTFFHTT